MTQTIPSQFAVGQIHPGVLASLSPSGSAWRIRLECGLDAVAPRPYGSTGPVQGDAVFVRVLGINATSGAVVGNLVEGKTVPTIP